LKCCVRLVPRSTKPSEMSRRDSGTSGRTCSTWHYA
jgi:hypothetical protein